MEDKSIFLDREDAGRRLAQKILDLHLKGDIVVAMPRGGVPIGLAVAKILQLPLKLYLVRKIGHPSNNEYAVGAVSESDLLLNADENLDKGYLEKKVKKERQRIAEMKKIFGRAASADDLHGKNAIIVDDGIATGSCMELAIREVRKAGARSIIVAVPVCPANTQKKIQPLTDHTISLLEPLRFTGIGAYYQDFSQLTDQEVVEMLTKVAQNEISVVEKTASG